MTAPTRGGYRPTMEVGQRVGPFRIVGVLGTGGSGEVYEALDSKLNRTVALKVLSNDISSDAGRRARFEQEARAASRLDHPNVVTIHDIGEVDGRVYIAMQLVRGRSCASS